jgi:spore germination cell wall hydrolase CwlJ-like protein
MAFDLYLGTATAFMEASGEPLEGEQAVCHVMANRLKDGRWGATLASVVLWPEQFSCWLAGDPNRHRMAITPDIDPVLQRIQACLKSALDGSAVDITAGAMWYFNPSVVLPSWAQRLTLAGQFGSQLFYR